MRTGLVAAVLALGSAVMAGAQAPAIDPVKGVENAASFVQGQPIAPGSFIAIFGNNFGSGLTLFSTVPLSTSLAGASVTIGGIPVPMIGVTANQIDAQMPWNLPSSGSLPVVVQTAAGSSVPMNVPLTTAAPGLFTIYTDPTGVNRPSAYNNADGSLPLPTNITITGYVSRPSKPGEVLVIFCTGLGAVNNPPVNGGAGLAQSPYSTTIATPVVLVGGVQANVLFSGLSPQYPSFYQISIAIPNVPPGNAVPLQIQMNGVTTTNLLQIAIGQ